MQNLKLLFTYSLQITPHTKKKTHTHTPIAKFFFVTRCLLFYHIQTNHRTSNKYSAGPLCTSDALSIVVTSGPIRFVNLMCIQRRCGTPLKRLSNTASHETLQMNGSVYVFSKHRKKEKTVSRHCNLNLEKRSANYTQHSKSPAIIFHAFPLSVSVPTGVFFFSPTPFVTFLTNNSLFTCKRTSISFEHKNNVNRWPSNEFKMEVGVNKSNDYIRTN